MLQNKQQTQIPDPRSQIPDPRSQIHGGGGGRGRGRGRGLLLPGGPPGEGVCFLGVCLFFFVCLGFLGLLGNENH